MIILKVLSKIIIFLLIFFGINYSIFNIKFIKLKLHQVIEKSKFAKLLDVKLKSLEGYNNLNKKRFYLNTSIIIIISICFSLVIYFLSISFIKIPSTSLILAVISFFVPYFVIIINLNLTMQKIKTILPSYIVNLKSNLEVTNNVIKAIAITKVEEPLKSNIDIFNLKVNRGINVYRCFDELKSKINIENFSNLIDAFKVCYENGGNYITVVNKYIEITSKENLDKSKLQENSRATIITLVLMVIINIFLIFSVVLSNEEYSNIILNTVAGHVIINFQIISYLIILYFVYRVYRMEE